MLISTDIAKDVKGAMLEVIYLDGVTYLVIADGTKRFLVNTQFIRVVEGVP